MLPGAPAADAPVQHPDGRRDWLLRQLGQDFTLLMAAGNDARTLAAAIADAAMPAVVKVLVIGTPGTAAPGTLTDADGLVAQRYGLRPGGAVLLRPDQHVCARWRQPTPQAVRGAVERALALH